jgi:hypothetical protein
MLPLAGCLFQWSHRGLWIRSSVSITLGRENGRARKHGGFQCNQTLFHCLKRCEMALFQADTPNMRPAAFLECLDC